MYRYQKGVGLVEVLVSLVLLAVAVLGFTAMQLRAVTASIESANNVQATTLARDLGERMRANRAGFKNYIDKPPASPKTDCNSTPCTPADIATFDYAQVGRKATAAGMSMNIVTCPRSTLSRKCILVAWDETSPTVGDSKPHCVNATASYVTGSKCIMMETYNQ
ncbi:MULTISPECIES: type IV pilus modification protein PilV [unclassified Acinetobacter]|uniref:type IV pilus modification protein PilV n=1 Tax=unclassified Acinetobacter TaxID=196816 RepID=UPI0035BA0EDA